MQAITPNARNKADIFRVEGSVCEESEIQAFLSFSPEDDTYFLNKLYTTYPVFKDYFDRSAQVREGYTIKEHTEMVLRRFTEQKKHVNLCALQKDLKIKDLEKLMLCTITLHDIGKAIGTRSAQHQNTIPLLEAVLKRVGYDEKAVELAKALVNHDTLGELVRPTFNRGVKQAYDKLKKISRSAQVPLQAFFELQRLFYTCDATSYPSVLKKCFLTKNGYFRPKSAKFQALVYRIYAKKNNS